MAAATEERTKVLAAREVPVVVAVGIQVVVEALVRLGKVITEVLLVAVEAEPDKRVTPLETKAEMACSLQYLVQQHTTQAAVVALQILKLIQSLEDWGAEGLDATLKIIRATLNLERPTLGAAVVDVGFDTAAEMAALEL